jgi:hypothetical protein
VFSKLDALTRFLTPSLPTPRLRGFGVTSVDRTAYPRFGRGVSGRELAESSPPTDAEIEWARTRTQDEQRLLALVVWLKSGH